MDIILLGGLWQHFGYNTSSTNLRSGIAGSYCRFIFRFLRIYRYTWKNYSGYIQLQSVRCPFYMHMYVLNICIYGYLHVCGHRCVGVHVHIMCACMWGSKVDTKNPNTPSIYIVCGNRFWYSCFFGKHFNHWVISPPLNSKIA